MSNYDRMPLGDYSDANRHYASELEASLPFSTSTSSSSLTATPSNPSGLPPLAAVTGSGVRRLHTVGRKPNSREGGRDLGNPRILSSSSGAGFQLSANSSASDLMQSCTMNANGDYIPNAVDRQFSSGNAFLLAKNSVVLRREDKETMLSRIGACKVGLTLPSDCVDAMFSATTTTASTLRQELMELEQKEIQENLARNRAGQTYPSPKSTYAGTGDLTGSLPPVHGRRSLLTSLSTANTTTTPARGGRQWVSPSPAGVTSPIEASRNNSPHRNHAGVGAKGKPLTGLDWTKVLVAKPTFAGATAGSPHYGADLSYSPGRLTLGGESTPGFPQGMKRDCPLHDIPTRQSLIEVDFDDTDSNFRRAHSVPLFSGSGSSPIDGRTSINDTHSLLGMTSASMDKVPPKRFGAKQKKPIPQENIFAYLNRRAGNAAFVGFDEDALGDYTKTLRPSLHRTTFDHDRLEEKLAMQLDTLKQQSRLERKRQERENQRLAELEEMRNRRRPTVVDNRDPLRSPGQESFRDSEISDLPEIWQFERDNMKSEFRNRARVGEDSQLGDSHEGSTTSGVFPLSFPKAHVILPELQKLREKLDELETFGINSYHPSQAASSSSAASVRIKGEKDQSESTAEFRTIGTKIGIRISRNTRWTPWKHVTVEPDPWVEGEPYNVAMETDTNIPSQDLHLYQLYCYYKNMVIILRPVSTAVPALYQGTHFLDKKYCDLLGAPMPQPQLSKEEIAKATRHECRAKGKSINVSLKSSSYPPIDGLIPVNPALGKAYLDAQRREREIEDMILNAQGGVLTINLLRKLKAQKAQAGSLTQAFVRDIQKSLSESDINCAKLMEEYKRELVLTVDKAAVSRQYLDSFNEAQFLGTTEAKWRGWSVYYSVNANGDVIRTEAEVPIFYIKKDTKFFRFSQEKADVLDEPVTDASNLRVVLVVTHRTFFMSPTTHRIEEETEAYLIGPDFDGLAYAQHVDSKATLEDMKRVAQMNTSPFLIKSMGLVTEADVEHIKEVRLLTEWKQNHGYESGNTVKSQVLGKGTYVVVTPKIIKILDDYQEIIGFYRSAWVQGIPLLLNPNWKVVIDRGGLPCPYGEDLHIPVVDDCGYAALLSHMDAERCPIGYADFKEFYEPMEIRAERIASGLKHFESAKIQAASPYGDLYTEFLQVEDKKLLAKLFYDVRRWQLAPPWWRLVDTQGLKRDNNGSVRFQKRKVGNGEDGSGAASPIGTAPPSPKHLESKLNKTLRSAGQGQGDGAPSANGNGGGTASPEDQSPDSSIPPSPQRDIHSQRNDLDELFFFDPDFEAFRAEMVEPRKQLFEEQAALFEKVHHRNPFAAMLRDYVTPEDEPIDVMGDNFVMGLPSLRVL